MLTRKSPSALGVHERRRKSGRTALVSVGLCDKGEPDFFVRGDFFCSSFVWQTKEEKSQSEAQGGTSRFGHNKDQMKK
jgi:hypothetical protein